MSQVKLRTLRGYGPSANLTVHTTFQLEFRDVWEGKLRIRTLDDKSDYGLWIIIIIATLDGKKLSSVIFSESANEEDWEKELQGILIMVRELRDQASLRDPASLLL